MLKNLGTCIRIKKKREIKIRIQFFYVTKLAINRWNNLHDLYERAQLVHETVQGKQEKVLCLSTSHA